MNIDNKVLTLGAFCLLMLGGCSKEDGNTSSTPQHDLIEPNPVKIELSSQTKELVSATTRAALEGDADMDIVDIGIFGLARATQVWSPSDLYNLTKWNWADWNSYDANRACILYNVRSNKVGTNIEWVEQDAIYFYPITQVYAYDFYGYYPWVADASLVKTDTKVSVQYTINGTQDLLWGRATSTDPMGYSARYFRQSSTSNGEKPDIALNHLLTRLTFSVVPGESYSGSNDYTAATYMSVEEVKILDAKTHLEVTIADLNNLNMEISDRITAYDNTTADLTLYKDDGQTTATAGVPTSPSNPVTLGESIMLLPEAQYEIYIKLKLNDPNNFGEFDQTFVTEVPLSLLPVGTEFEPGKSYSVKIIVHGPRDISLQSTLVEWDEETGPEIEL